jgi:hypothetical protein
MRYNDLNLSKLKSLCHCEPRRRRGAAIYLDCFVAPSFCRRAPRNDNVQREYLFNNLNMRPFLVVAAACWILVNSLGCEAFVKKFTRKPKKEDMQKEEMVLAPQEYAGPQMSADDRYRQNLLFWRSWHDEIIESLSSSTNHKRQVYCAQKAKDNLMSLRPLLLENMRDQLDALIRELNSLENSIADDLYGRSTSSNRQSAENLKRKIIRAFSYKKVKDSLLQ